MHSYSQLKDIVHSAPPDLAVILGSGLSGLAQALQNPVSVSYHEVPNMPTASVAGHEGKIVFGQWAGRHILFFQGRFHRYEGHPWERVLRPIHLAHELGAKHLLVTNAAGGIRDDLVPGIVMLLDGAIDWTRLVRCETPPIREWFQNELTERMQKAALQISMNLPTGVYAQLLGPCYETPAEIRALRHCGADAVGMSTVREIEAAHQLEMECVALSLITNRAAGLSSGPLHHDEVLATGAQSKLRMIALVEKFVRLI